MSGHKRPWHCKRPTAHFASCRSVLTLIDWMTCGGWKASCAASVFSIRSGMNCVGFALPVFGVIRGNDAVLPPRRVPRYGLIHGTLIPSCNAALVGQSARQSSDSCTPALPQSKKPIAIKDAMEQAGIHASSKGEAGNGPALCANIDATTSSSFITVEGKEEGQDERSWKRAREPASG
jgi:hypothetical protein